jgi:bacterioferritin (cytochrome b1)
MDLIACFWGACLNRSRFTLTAQSRSSAARQPFCRHIKADHIHTGHARDRLTTTGATHHAKQELDHALILSRQIDYLGKMPVVTPKPVRTSKNPKDMLRYDLDNENETIRNYRDRIRQCETLGEYAMAEQIRQILMQEQDHQIDLATALGIPVPDVSGGPKGRTLGKRR